MPLMFDSHRNLAELLFDDPLLAFAVETLGAVLILLDAEDPQPEPVSAVEEVLL